MTYKNSTGRTDEESSRVLVAFDLTKAERRWRKKDNLSAEGQ